MIGGVGETSLMGLYIYIECLKILVLICLLISFSPHQLKPNCVLGVGV
jgi:hypothetical protein